METDYPFSASFGIASTRRTCVNSAIRLYNKLLKLQNDGDVLRFATIAEVAMLNAKSADSQKMRHMLQVFRPDKDEVVTLVDFAGAVDNVYKKLTLLKRSIENAAAIDRAYEHMINAGFFTVVFVIVLAALGIDPLAFILALSSLIVSFAFMIGSAASNYFEGILLILLRRPYEIGDRIAVSAVDDPAETDGSAGWIVENIDLYTTTVRLAATREVATVSNGSLARSRIINMKRSEKALLTIFLRFSVDTPFEKIVILKNAVEVYVKERPQVRRQRIVVREPNDCFF
jgi:small-conductance mechanosensitive channel